MLAPIMSRIMAESNIPKQVDALKLVSSQQSFSASVATNDWLRLRDSVQQCDDQASVSLSFFRDEDNFPVVSGTISLQVALVCQRCLDDVRVDVSSEFQLGLVFSDEQAKALPKRLEPVEMDEHGQLDVWSILEDEALLSLPDFPKHSPDECKVKLTTTESDDDIVKDNPFDVLAALKKH